MLNQVNLVGRLARDPKLVEMESDSKRANLVVAVERDYKNKEGKRKTDFIYVTVWNRLAEQCDEFLSKGRLIAVQGRIEVSSWNDQETGEKRYRTGIIAREVKFLDSPREEVSA
ncbi:single-stranded DNA-binding protein [Natroniella acetigena]|uniref:single-stranded DNA-binding protein n=1 Tax=Natroniella acetigena TaxID=52004 RepID=UPI00200AC2ED|nr:single-stranded DNA-binding protein [Natroniella acetigena]MCK8826764.1 single-stranded DNA-binding protein [Natroniella acetigena]